MSTSEIIGTIGVTLILLAYFLQLRNFFSKDSNAYLLLNFFGALLACISSILISFFPFIILEAVWALVSVASLIKKIKHA